MTRRFTTLLICLLMAALPLQGFAAVLKSFCGPSHHHALTQDAPAAASRHHQTQHHVAGNAHAQHQHGQQALQADLADSDRDPTSAVQSAYCSACAACCVGAVAPPSASVAPGVDSDPIAVILPASPALAGVVPAGLERPPKLLA